MHITASVFINDAESGLHADFERWLEKLAPEKPHSAYDHNRTGEDNADAQAPGKTSDLARVWHEFGAALPRARNLTTVQPMSAVLASAIIRLTPAESVKKI